VAATIVDHSVNGPGGDWEGSSALIRALGGKPYWSGTCGGASSGTVSGVRITMR
jgi:hypothetical protein